MRWLALARTLSARGWVDDRGVTLDPDQPVTRELTLDEGRAFLAGPISYPGLVIQAVGRALRRHEAKTNVIVHDYVDTNVPVLKAQYARRRQAYRQMGFTE